MYYWIEETKQEIEKAVKGIIFYDHSISLWTLCLYDEQDNILNHTEYEHYKRDILEKRKDYPHVKVWEVYKRTG